MAPLSLDAILTEVDTLVGDKLQICTYKSLCRRFGVPANTAKQILFEFAEKRRGDVSVVYYLSGVSKQSGRESVQLVTDAQLTSRRGSLKSVSGMHVYSIQPRIPKDPSEIFADEKAAAEEEMQKLISGKETYIADNRFSAVVAHHVNRDPTAVQPPPKPPAATTASKRDSLPKVTAPAIATEKPSKPSATTLNPNPSAQSEAGHVTTGPSKRKEPQAKEGAKGSLGALWSRVPAKKAKVEETDEANKQSAPAAMDSSDDEAEEDIVQVMNKVNRQRRICMDDDEDKGVAGDAAPLRPRSRGVVLDDEEEEDNSHGAADDGTAKKAEDVEMSEAKDQVELVQRRNKGKKGGGKSGASGRSGTSAGDEDEMELSRGGENGAREVKKPSGISTAFAKQGAAGTASKPASQPAGKWVEKTFYDDKGNEVTELVFEADPMVVSQPEQEARHQAGAATAAHDAVTNKPGKEANATKSGKDSAAPKSGKPAHGSSKQKGIMSFFGKK